MSNPKDDAELARALEDHIIHVGDPALPPKPAEAEPEPEKPEDKLELGQNVEDFQIDVPPEEGL